MPAKPALWPLKPGFNGHKSGFAKGFQPWALRRAQGGNSGGADGGARKTQDAKGAGQTQDAKGAGQTQDANGTSKTQNARGGRETQDAKGAEEP